MTSDPAWEDAYAGGFELPPLRGPETLRDRQRHWKAHFEEYLYGPVPEALRDFEVREEPLDGTNATRVVLRMHHQGKTFEVDAALWRPANIDPAPLVVGLGFTGPLGVLDDSAFPVDPNARAFSRPELGAPAGYLDECLRGSEAYRWPVERLTDKGFAVLVSCYGSWAPDDRHAFHQHGLQPFLGAETGAISLWAWAISRLIDGAGRLGGIETEDVVTVGHSRLGKAALWAGVQDMRIGTVFANNAGCGGTAPAAHGTGETLAQMATDYPHWIKPQTKPLPIDQHHLMGCLAPRRLYVASARQDLWADPVGSYIALSKAANLWPDKMDWPDPEAMWSGQTETHHKSLGHHLRPGDHDMMPLDWERFLAFHSAAECRQGFSGDQGQQV